MRQLLEQRVTTMSQVDGQTTQLEEKEGVDQSADVEAGTIEVMIRPLTVHGLAARFQRSRSVPKRGETQDLPSSLATKPTQGVELCVRDQGMGIASEQLEQIFAPFQRLDTTLTRRVPSLGLGLTLCQRLVDLHGGRIWAESVVGEGSAFHVCLPATPE